MTFTKEQIETLSAWEENFRTAVRAKWARNPGRTALRVIYDIYTAATGDRRRFSDNCSDCILSLLHDCGEIYYRDVEEMARMAAESKDKAKVVELSTGTKKTVRKAMRTQNKGKDGDKTDQD